MALRVNKGERMLRNTVVVSVVVFYCLFFVYPILQALVGSFHLWNPLKGQFKFVGWDNYTDALSEDLFWLAMGNNVVFTVTVVVARVGLALLVALAIARIPRLKSLFRTVYFLPVISSLIAVAFVWRWMYEPNIGLINKTVGIFGIQGKNWLLDPDTALLSIIVMTIWKDLGYAVVILLAGILNLNAEVFEAAAIDGAKPHQVLWRITLPLLNPTILFVVVTSLISYLQTFAQVFVLTGGGPGTKTYLTTYQIFNEAFVKYNFGYSSALSFLLFLVIMVLTWVQFRVTGNDEDRS
jgi:multiple sugar transport system permease protein